ncbi:Uncharacterised protein [Mycobacteroides abscessus subsp. abscessus]|nr:Uncharacterised protein [Mycobacteroides abscessus subsp. abscessus]
MVSAEAPDMAFGIALEHRGRAASHIVDIVDLP